MVVILRILYLILSLINSLFVFLYPSFMSRVSDPERRPDSDEAHFGRASIIICI